MTTPHARGTTNKNQQPNTAGRRRLRQHILDRDGDGTSVECALKISPKCLGTLTIETISLDRYPIPATDNGTYRRDNVRGVCVSCNSKDGSDQMHVRLGHTLKGRTV